LPSPGANGSSEAAAFRDVTVRQLVRISAGGKRVRLRLTNEYGDRPLAVGAARIAIADGANALAKGTERVVTFGGDRGTTIPAGAPLLSDPIELIVAPLTMLSISLYFPDGTGPCTCHWTGRQTAYISGPGDHSSGTFQPAGTTQSRAFLSGVEVEALDTAHTVVVLGDSFADGVGSMLDRNGRWPDRLAERLAARPGVWGVVNAGVSGNALLNAGAGASALARFDRDVLAISAVTHVIVSIGLDELGVAFGPRDVDVQGPRPPIEPSAQAMIAGYRQLISRAHSKGLKVYGATLTPYEDAGYYSERGEAVREAVNAWLRGTQELDGLLDFDQALRDRDAPTRIVDSLQSGDHLHANDDGYHKVADSVDLHLFD
jgi:lysophospholipase L1-like esterase